MHPGIKIGRRCNDAAAFKCPLVEIIFRGGTCGRAAATRVPGAILAAARENTPGLRPCRTNSTRDACAFSDSWNLLPTSCGTSAARSQGRAAGVSTDCAAGLTNSGAYPAKGRGAAQFLDFFRIARIGGFVSPCPQDTRRSTIPKSARGRAMRQAWRSTRK